MSPTVHAFIRKTWSSAQGGRRGGPDPLWRLGQTVNAKELLAVANVNGALVGGASLKADDFLGIAAAYL